MNYILPHTVINAAIRFPDREAFTDGNRRITFRQHKEKMCQLAALLTAQGVKKGDRVGVFINRTLDTAVAIYGIMMAGAIYVPLDTQSPPQLLDGLMEECGIKILISNASQKRNIKSLLTYQAENGDTVNGLEVIIGVEKLEQVRSIPWKELEKFPTDFTPENPILADDPAYIIYTSGSTGKPKGIVHSHSSGLSYAKLVADLFQLNESDRIANHAPVFFDISLLGYFAGPLVGAATLIIPDAYIALPASLSNLIEKEKISIWYSVPLALIQLLQQGILEKRNLSALRWILYAGEAFPPKYLSELMAQLPEAKYSNIYGPAETNQCTYYHIPEIPSTDQPIPIGTVWGDTEYLIVENSSAESSLENESAKEGELLIRSSTMMKGYFKRPTLTANAFYKKRNSAGFDITYYKTGDLVRLDEKGVLHFLGRKDHQVKTRGYRVELGAVEAAVLKYEAIKEAAVFTHQKEDDTLGIVTAVIPKSLSSFEQEALINFLKKELPFYAVPGKVFVLESFPRTGSGKTDRGAIKEGIYQI